MTLPADILWLNFSPALRRFDRPLLKKLSKERAILEWDYTHTPDEPNSLEAAPKVLYYDGGIHSLGTASRASPAPTQAHVEPHSGTGSQP